MSNSIFHVRPLDSGKGWAIDEYDGRGAWQHSVPIGPDGSPMDKIQARRAVFQLRRKAVNSAKPTAPVNKESSLRQRTTSDVACADVAHSNDPRVLINVAHQHWYGIGWREDAKPVALLERAMALLDGSVSGADAVCMEAVGTPGVRDPANRCDMFSPGKPTNGGCQGDGHYLCAGCMLLEVPR